jgi:hypothetical protein
MPPGTHQKLQARMMSLPTDPTEPADRLATR